MWVKLSLAFLYVCVWELTTYGQLYHKLLTDQKPCSRHHSSPYAKLKQPKRQTQKIQGIAPSSEINEFTGSDREFFGNYSVIL